MRVNNHYFYENEAAQKGFRFIAGGDEAGRGPWAGPVFAAFVVLSDSDPIEGLDDSKKLTRKKRSQLYKQIKSRSIACSSGMATPEEIDKINILEATRLAFKRAFAGLKNRPDFVLLDYIKLPWLEVPFQSFAKGESISASVAAASIVAKEERDCFMESVAKNFAGYGFEKHKGYGTALHRQALERLGPCEHHRLSFKPVKKYLNTDPESKYESLFELGVWE
jgi:ribonuclease HII